MTSELAFDDADLNGFVDGRIEPGRAAALAESLASDPEARARLDAWKRQNESLRTMFASVLFEPVPVRLLPSGSPPQGSAGVAAPPLRHTATSSGGISGVLAMTSLGMALVGFAAGALTAIGTDDFGLPSRTVGSARDVETRAAPPADAALAALALATHRTFLGDALRPVEITAAEEPKLLRWIQHRLGPAFRIPDLTRRGWALIGGRIVPGPQGPAAFLVYGNGAERLGLTVSRTAGMGDLALGGAATGTATWGEGEFGYALTTDRGVAWLAHNAGPLRDGVRGAEDGALPPPPDR